MIKIRFFQGLRIQNLHLIFSKVKTHCKNVKVELSFYVVIKEDIEKLNTSSGYYNDICYTLTTEKGTDECLEEWNDYNEYMSHRVEEASNNVTEQDTHYLLKDVYGYIEVYYLDENNKEYLYKKTDISTDYLTEEDRDDLQVGIEVVGIEELNKMLEILDILGERNKSDLSKEIFSRFCVGK